MTARFVAFLRAINVGGRVVRMDALRRHVEGAGFDDVETVIQSGNVVFSCGTAGPEAEARIEAALAAALGYRVATFVRSAREVGAVARRHPFAPSEPNGTNTLYVAFVRSRLGAAARSRVEALSTAVDDLRVSGREVYWLRRRAVGESAITGAVLEKALGGEATVRNLTTVERIVAKHFASTREPRRGGG